MLLLYSSDSGYSYNNSQGDYMIEKIFVRNCPNCGCEVRHTTKKNRNSAIKHKRFCGRCRAKEVQNRDGVFERKSNFCKNRFTGDGNPFYGKHHTEDSLRRSVESRKKKLYVWKTKKFRNKMSKVTRGKNNGMYGKNFYDCWVNKYGKEEANFRLGEYKKKKSINLSGKNNPMYGKPSPVGSGNGWSGWYKGWYFRSLRELSYMIMVIEKKNYKWITAESNKLAIKYKDYDGTCRTYRADFLLNDSVLVEVKPKALMGTINNRLKKEAAIKFCKEKGLRYSMVDIKLLDILKIIELYQSGVVEFIEKYKKSIEEIICKKKLQ